MPPKTTTTYTENIGIGGISVVLNEDLHIFHNVELELFLEDGSPPISCKGSIVWVVKKGGLKGRAGYDTGIEFTSLKGEDKARIVSLVEAAFKKGDLA